MEIDKEICSIGDLYPYPVRIPRQLIDDLKERGYNVSKLIRLKLFEASVGRELDGLDAETLKTKIKELRNG